MKIARTPKLLLDEMYLSSIAAALRDKGFDVIAANERADLRSTPDDDLFTWAVAEGRWLVTENVKDFLPILTERIRTHEPLTTLLCTSARSFPRSRRNPGPLIAALAAFLLRPPPHVEGYEYWLQPPG
jgi:hypothetical protein